VCLQNGKTPSAGGLNGTPGKVRADALVNDRSWNSQVNVSVCPARVCTGTGRHEEAVATSPFESSKALLKQNSVQLRTRPAAKRWVVAHPPPPRRPLSGLRAAQRPVLTAALLRGAGSGRRPPLPRTPAATPASCTHRLGPGRRRQGSSTGDLKARRGCCRRSGGVDGRQELLHLRSVCLQRCL